jgi:nitrite reductase/ring-hydroxylating ferredoxin subunit
VAAEPADDFIDVGAEGELAEGTMKGVDVGPDRVLIARVGGRLCAIGGLCSHQIAHLEDGVLEGTRVLCPRHGAAFDLLSGEPLTAPADMPVAVFDVQVVDGRLRVRPRPCPGS